MHAIALLTSGPRILKSTRPMRIFAVPFSIRPMTNKVPLLHSTPKIPFLMRGKKMHTTLRNNAGKYQWDYFWRSQETDGNVKYYCVGLVFIMTGLSFAFIPFYQMLCEQTSFTGLAQIANDLERIVNMEKVEDRLIRVQFNADVPSSMQWKFKPLQDEIYVHPGETALAFFTATNPTDKPIVGISTYNLMPFQSAYYFNKIQCFCFDEQILNPGEEVDLPVFFYIDPDFVNDPLLENMDEILLSYTFFESGTVKNLPSPFDPNNRPKTFPKAVEKSSGTNENENITKKALRQLGADRTEVAKNIIQQ